MFSLYIHWPKKWDVPIVSGPDHLRVGVREPDVCLDAFDGRECDVGTAAVRPLHIAAALLLCDGLEVCCDVVGLGEGGEIEGIGAEKAVCRRRIAFALCSST